MNPRHAATETASALDRAKSDLMEKPPRHALVSVLARGRGRLDKVFAPMRLPSGRASLRAARLVACVLKPLSRLSAAEGRPLDCGYRERVAENPFHLATG